MPAILTRIAGGNICVVRGDPGGALAVSMYLSAICASYGDTWQDDVFFPLRSGEDTSAFEF